MEKTKFEILLLNGEDDFETIESFRNHDEVLEKFEEVVKNDIGSKMALKVYDSDDEKTCVEENRDKYKVGIYGSEDEKPASILDFDKFRIYIENVKREIEQIEKEENVENSKKETE